MIRRLIGILALVACIVGLLALLPDRAASFAAPSRLPDPTSLAVGAAGSTWYCPSAGPAWTEVGTHEISISNPTSQARSASVTGYGTAAGAVAVTTKVDVPAHSVVAVDRATFGGEAAGSVLVEVNGGGVVVSQRLTSQGLGDEAPCDTAPSSHWYFGSADTQLGNSARLWLFNPFAADASVNVTVASDNGVRSPRKYSGLVIAARSSRFVDLNEEQQRYDQFAVTIDSRDGQFIAGLVELTGGDKATSGLRIDPGMSATSKRILFPDSVGAEGLSDRLVVYNPSANPVDGLVTVRPDGADPAAYPEPFILQVPARRYVIVDLNSETRLPPTGQRTITVETDDPAGLVATQVLSTASASSESLVSNGTATATGLTVAAGEWLVPRVDQAGAGRSIIRIVNPSSDTIAVVRVRAAAGGKVTDAIAGGKVEVPPGRAVTVDVGVGVVDQVPAVITVSSDTAVVVDRRAAGSSKDFWMSAAVPVAGSIAPLTALPNAPTGGK